MCRTRMVLRSKLFIGFAEARLEMTYVFLGEFFSDKWDFNAGRSVPRLSNRIWHTCSEMRLIMKMRIEVTKRRALMFVKRPYSRKV